MAPRRARIAFSDSAAKQLEELSENAVHALDRTLVAISVNPEIGDPIPGPYTQPPCASTPTRSKTSASSTSSPPCAPWLSAVLIWPLL